MTRPTIGSHADFRRDVSDAAMVERIARQLVSICNEVKYDDARAWPQYIKDARAIAEMVDSECFKMAAGVCEHRSGDDHGNPYCLKSKTNI